MEHPLVEVVGYQSVKPQTTLRWNCARFHLCETKTCSKMFEHEHIRFHYSRQPEAISFRRICQNKAVNAAWWITNVKWFSQHTNMHTFTSQHVYNLHAIFTHLLSLLCGAHVDKACYIHDTHMHSFQSCLQSSTLLLASFLSASFYSFAMYNNNAISLKNIITKALSKGTIFSDQNKKLK